MPAVRTGPSRAVPAPLRALIALLLVAFPLAPATAHEGHDHGAPVAVAADPALPMVEATGTDLEMAGLVKDGRLILWIDRFADNAPVTAATVDVGVGGATVRAESQPDGTFAVDAPWAAEAGDHDVLVSVAADGVSDLLVGTLTVAEQGEGASGTAGLHWGWAVAAFLAGVLVAAAVAALARPARGAPAPSAAEAATTARTATAAALLLALAAAATPGEVRAHAGHDHGPPTPTITSPEAPRRQPDGSLFVPKRTQRLLDVRTVQVAMGAAPRTLAAVGRVVADPNTSGRVQASQSGRFEPPPGGLPHVGQRVEAGQLLGYVVPAVDTIARGDVQERLASVEKELVIARRQVARLDKLTGVVSDREIEDARALLAGLERQRAALNPALVRREELLAPVSGVIAASTAVPGLVIDDRDATVLYEIVDPAGLLVEAVSFDAAAPMPTGAATARPPEGPALDLTFVGRGPVLREGATPLLFRVAAPPADLAIGTPVRVEARVAGSVEGFPLPREAVVRGGDGLALVWVRTGPQRFEPRPVRFQPIDGGTVAVTAGLEEGDRVVTRAANLLNQIR